MPPKTVTVELREEVASELVEILRDEVSHADEFHSTEQLLHESAEAIESALESSEHSQEVWVVWSKTLGPVAAFTTKEQAQAHCSNDQGVAGPFSL